MISLIVHAVLGVLTTVLMVRWNPDLFRGWRRQGVTPIEAALVVIGVASVAMGWYFNIRYVQEWGKTASWVHFTQSLFENWAAKSAAQDYILANAVLFPLWTIPDGRRRGIARPWIFFVMSLFTSFAFSMAAYILATERQARVSGRVDDGVGGRVEQGV
jgi:SNF family Na+-dependent transporter